VIVVPREPKGWQAQQSIVTALVLRWVGSRSEPVADGVDTPDEVVHKENPHQTAPQQAEQQTFP